MNKKLKMIITNSFIDIDWLARIIASHNDNNYELTLEDIFSFIKCRKCISSNLIKNEMLINDTITICNEKEELAVTIQYA